jgi:small subunit ribosomal protein S6
LREYETVFVLHPGLEDSRIEEEIEGVRSTIAAASGEIIDVERWGRRKLAYTIGKVNEGIYTLVRFRAESNAISDLERRYRLREDILRHLTVQSQGPPPAEMAHRREEAAGQAGDTTQGDTAQATSENEATTPGPAPVTTSEPADSPGVESTAKGESDVN